MGTAVRLLALVAAGTPACSILFPFDPAAEGDGDADADVDGDTDGDTDADADGDADGDACHGAVEEEPNDRPGQAQVLGSSCLASESDASIEVAAQTEGDGDTTEDWYRIKLPDGHGQIYVETAGPDWQPCDVDTTVMLYMGQPLEPVPFSLAACLAGPCTGVGAAAAACNDDCRAGDDCEAGTPCSSVWTDVTSDDEVYIRVVFCDADEGRHRYLLYVD